LEIIAVQDRFTVKIPYVKNGKFEAGKRHIAAATLASPSWLGSVADFGPFTLLATGPKYAASGTSRSPALWRGVLLPYIYYFHPAGVTGSKSCAFTVKIPSIKLSNERFRSGRRHQAFGFCHYISERQEVIGNRRY